MLSLRLVCNAKRVNMKAPENQLRRGWKILIVNCDSWPNVGWSKRREAEPIIILCLLFYQKDSSGNFFVLRATFCNTGTIFDICGKDH